MNFYRKHKKKCDHAIMAIGVGLLGFLVSVLISVFLKKPPIEQVEMKKQNVFVDTFLVQNIDYIPKIKVTGLVEIRKHIVTVPVQGEIKKISKKLKNGARFNKGEFLFSIKKAPLLLEREKAKARLCEIEKKISEIEANVELNRMKWDFEMSGEPFPDVLAMKKEMEEFQARLDSAVMDFKLAEKDVESCVMVAPFDCIIIDSKINEGLHVGRGTEVLTMYAHDVGFLAAVSERQLKSIKIKDINSEIGSKVRINENIYGRVTNLLGAFDPETHVASIFIKPNQEDIGKKFFHGEICNLEILGEKIPNVCLVPQTMMEDGNIVWIVFPDGKVFKRKVEVVGEFEHSMAVTGLMDEEVVVASNFDELKDGLRVSF